MKGLLLDTHIWIWYANGNDTISKALQNKIYEAAGANQLFLAEISIWELSMLVKKKRIVFEMPLLEWIEQSLIQMQINLLSMNPKIAVESCNLPGYFHEDPADRIIIATARVENLTLVTHDKRILQYSRKDLLATV